VPTIATRRDGVETRQAIIDAALDLFAARGFEGASTRQIAQQAAVTQPALSYHFDGKEELWRAAVGALFDRLGESIARRLKGLAGVDDRTVATLMVRHFVEFSAVNPQLHRIIMQESTQPGPRLDWLVTTYVRPLYASAVEILERLRGGAPLPATSAAHLYYLLTGAGATVFVMAPECERLTGVDPFEPTFITAHADLVVEMIVASVTQEQP